MDITDPKNPRLIAEYDLDDRFGIAQKELGDGSSFLHDMVVKEIDGVQTMLASYWDGGYVQLNVENPRDIRLINHTDFTVPDPERAKRGETSCPRATPTRPSTRGTTASSSPPTRTSTRSSSRPPSPTAASSTSLSPPTACRSRPGAR
jgi:hypothetical protein